MKRIFVAGAAVLAAAMPFHTERKEPDCKHEACAGDLVASVPEQAHGFEELPTDQIPEGMVEIPTSPVTFVERGSEAHLKWIRANG